MMLAIVLRAYVISVPLSCWSVAVELAVFDFHMYAKANHELDNNTRYEKVYNTHNNARSIANQFTHEFFILRAQVSAERTFLM